jgi:Fe-S-cluster containining protein
VGLQFENVVFPDQVSFHCKGCGRCCKEQPADVTAEDQTLIEAKGFTGFLDENDLTEPRLIRSKKDGACFFLTANNKCMIEDVKPTICRLVPFVVTDWDYKQNLIEVDLPPDFDCPGIHEGCPLPLETLAKAAQVYVRDTQNLIAKREKLHPTDPKVLSKTRQLIIKQSLEDLST